MYSFRKERSQSPKAESQWCLTVPLPQIRGRGFDYATLIRDFNLMKWFGANSIRTSKHPPPNELLELTDKHGIVVIDESPTARSNKIFLYVYIEL